MWEITARYIVKLEDGWTCASGVPTFFLDGDVQCISGEDHAIGIARKILTAVSPRDGQVEWFISAVRVDRGGEDHAARVADHRRNVLRRETS